MDSKIPKLERPQKRLRYFISQECKSTELQDKRLQLKDIDKLFDDLDSTSEEELDLPTLSPVLKTCPAVEEQGSALPVPEQSPLTETCLVSQAVTPEELKCETIKALYCPTLDAEVVTPFKEHSPIKTSSPIEQEVHVDNADCCYRDKTASPLLFVCEDEEDVPPKLNPSTSQEVPCSGQATESGDDLGVDSPPTKFALLCKKKAPCEENRKILENPPQFVQCAVPQSIPQESSQERSCPLVSTVTQDTQPPCEPRPSLVTEDKSKEKQKDAFAFLLKLREASQPIPARSKPVPSKVSEPPPEDFDDDFMILEDDGPSLFSIPRKTDPNKSKARAKQNKVPSSSSNKDASADVVPQRDHGGCAPGEQEAPEGTENPAQQEGKGRKGKAAHRGASPRPVLSTCTDKKGAVIDREQSSSPGRLTRPESESGGFTNQDDRDKPQSKKKGATKVSSKATSAEEDGKKDRHGQGASAKPSKRKQKTEEKAPKPSDAPKSKPAKDGLEKPKRGRGKSAKGSKELSPGLEPPEPAEEPGHVEDLEENGGDGDRKEEEDSAPERAKNKLPKGQIKATSKGPSNPKGRESKPVTVGVSDPRAESPVLAKRKKCAPGAWWLGVSDRTTNTEADSGPAVKKSKQSSRKTAKASPPVVQDEALEGGVSDRKPSKLSSRRSADPQPKKAGARARHTRKRKSSRPKPEKPAETEVEVVVDCGSHDQGELSPQPSPLRQHTSTPSEKVFDRVYGRTPNPKSALNHPSTPLRPHNHENIPMQEKRCRKAPGNWWEIGSPPADVEATPSPPRKPKDKNTKTQKGEAKHPKPHKSPSLRPHQNGRLAGSPKPRRTVHEPPLKKKDLSAPKTAKRSLATFAAIFTSSDTVPPVERVRSAARRGGRKTLFPSQGQGSAQSSLASEGTNTEDVDAGQEPSGSLIPCDDTSSPVGTPTTSVCMESVGELGKRLSWPSISQRLSDNTLKGFISGPSSMIDLEHHEEDEDMCLPSSRLSVPVLAGSELCGPPLRPLLLQQEDRANLQEWLKVLWPTTIKGGGQITPEQFQWYSYRGRALGLRVDLQASSFCSGRILLGSFMKKPLWVDHSFTSVYNVLTSCVRVTLNGKVSLYNPGQTFMVPCGHAYNIHNLAQEPAVLYFNRMQAESPE
ncbi:serine/arginine repetitive matrix protein 1 [Osmerus mordax]|uniref:serine/arginine repetitive matrix protein 1 n=1 Tax=Osmerus mordax TaxID=8014 RepID=UPI0035105D5A